MTNDEGKPFVDTGAAPKVAPSNADLGAYVKGKLKSAVKYTLMGLGALFVFIIIVGWLTSDAAEEDQALAAAEAAATSAKVGSKGPMAKVAAEVSSGRKGPRDSEIRELLAPGVSLSASASSGQAYCNGPVTYVFEPVRGDGVQTVSKHLSETDFIRTGTYTVLEGKILVKNVTRQYFDKDQPSAADENWAITVTAVDPNGYEGGDLTVEGDGVLSGCDSSYLTE
jgi:hypothetical protein